MQHQQQQQQQLKLQLQLKLRCTKQGRKAVAVAVAGVAVACWRWKWNSQQQQQQLQSGFFWFLLWILLLAICIPTKPEKKRGHWQCDLWFSPSNSWPKWHQAGSVSPHPLPLPHLTLMLRLDNSEWTKLDSVAVCAPLCAISSSWEYVLKRQTVAVAANW